MNTLICITNNVVRDGRVKRQVNIAKRISSNVDVVCLPIPDRDCDIKDKNVNPIFVDIDLYNANIIERFKSALDVLGIRKEIIDICPFLERNNYYNKTIIGLYKHWLNIQLRGTRWKDIRNHIAEEMPDKEAMSFVVCSLIRMIVMAEEVISHPAEVVYCNDLDTLLCGVVHKRKYGSRLIYDVHDLLYDISSNEFPQMYCNFLALLEHKYIKEVNVLLGTGKYSLEWLADMHGITQPFFPIMNCIEEYRKEGIQSKSYDEEKPLTIYFHGFAAPDRNLHLIIEAINNIKELNFVIRSKTNDYVNSLRKMVEDYRIEDRVQILDFVPYDDVIRSSNKEGDVAIYASSPDSCLNWKYAITTKFVEYLAAGLPVITTDVISQSSIVRGYDCGFVIDKADVKSIETVLIDVINRKSELANMSKNALKATKEVFDWNTYEKKLEDLIKGENNIETIGNGRRKRRWYSIQDTLNKYRGIFAFCSLKILSIKH